MGLPYRYRTRPRGAAFIHFVEDWNAGKEPDGDFYGGQGGGMLDLVDMIASTTEYFANDKETIDHCACK